MRTTTSATLVLLALTFALPGCGKDATPFAQTAGHVAAGLAIAAAAGAVNTASDPKHHFSSGSSHGSDEISEEGRREADARMEAAVRRAQEFPAYP